MVTITIFFSELVAGPRCGGTGAKNYRVSQQTVDPPWPAIHRVWRGGFGMPSQGDFLV